MQGREFIVDFSVLIQKSEPGTPADGPEFLLPLF